ncbi:hypothetical protein CGCSCA5_v011107 [Colletotrichum siamense]|nr:hypothetical protein CGCSCA5_v011107 [Colletotrichum siamense]
MPSRLGLDADPDADNHPLRAVFGCASDHPPDRFNALRFSVRLCLPAGHEDDEYEDGPNNPDTSDSGSDADFVLQPVEICFHSDFTPSPDHPVSLHLDRRDRVILYPIPPVLPTPQPPCYIVECDPIDIGPSASSSLRPDDARQPPSKPATLFSRILPYIVACAAAAVSVAVFCIFTLPSPWPTRPPCPPRSTACPSAPAATVNHVAVPMSFLDELLALAAAWASVPETLLSLARPRGLAFCSATISDADLVRHFGKVVPLDQVVVLARSLVSAVLRASPGDPLASHSRPERSLIANIIDSASAATSTWEVDLEFHAGFRWIPAIADTLDWTRDRLRSTAHRRSKANTSGGDDGDDAVASFFASPESFNASGRRLSAATDGVLAIADMSTTMTSVLDTYNDTLLHRLGGHQCSFFRGCRLADGAGGQPHPLCELPELPPSGDVQPLVSFLEHWRRLQLKQVDDHAAAVPTSPPGPMSHQADVPLLMALAGQITAVAAEVDELLDIVRSRGLWDPLVPNAAAADPPQPAFWSSPMHYFSRSRKETASVSDVQTLATRLSAVRMSSILSQELAVVEAIVTSRSLCERTERLRAELHDLRRGRGSWVGVSFQDAPGFAVADGRLQVRSSHRVLLRHGVLPPLGVQADMVDGLRNQVHALAQNVSNSLRRLIRAQDQDAERIPPPPPPDQDAPDNGDVEDDEELQGWLEALEEKLGNPAASILAAAGI